jgi:hypothetical protein
VKFSAASMSACENIYYSGYWLALFIQFAELGRGLEEIRG